MSAQKTEEPVKRLRSVKNGKLIVIAVRLAQVVHDRLVEERRNLRRELHRIDAARQQYSWRGNYRERSRLNSEYRRHQLLIAECGELIAHMQMASSDLMRMRTRMFSDMMSEHAKLIERVVSSMDR